ncbi:large-conductance mechanosensitive channel protein MscL [uncultured Lactobacillus sp.]|uniref:large-conductance mechanosensitive channel protein MscL n=1 Tax=uncultured Lactobacillus sp. TaxID=153152 RepID=UPI00260EF097|nr:large-conductance mechanosensitive channel protein MscL [uncultured Lactobacillus sp.]
MIKEFKEFISRGNMMDLAVGVIIGAAFTAIVNSLVKNLINPLIGLFVGKIDLSDLKFSIGDATFRYGSFLNSVINFLIISLVVFLLIKLINKLMPKKKEEPKKEIENSELYLKEIRDILKEQNN